MVKCYRVWFADDSVMLCDAESLAGARVQGQAEALKRRSRIVQIESLD